MENWRSQLTEERNARIAILSLLLLLSSCAGPNTTVPSGPVGFAETAIQQGQWETAYEFLGDAFAASDHSRMARAQQLLLQYPQLLDAAKHTFTPQGVAATLSIQGEEKGIALERRRLVMYHAVALPADYLTAERNVNEAAAVIDAKRERVRAARSAELQRKAASQAALDAATRAARISCRSTNECQKAFALTQIFINEKADMKIQLATDSIVETYNPTENMRVSLKAVKIPGAGSSAEIVLSGSCKDGDSDGAAAVCASKLLAVYRSFPEYMRNALAP
jgi:hypothetical protein